MVKESRETMDHNHEKENLLQNLRDAYRVRGNLTRAISRLEGKLAAIGVRRCAVKDDNFCDKPECGHTKPPFPCKDDDELEACETCGDKFPKEMLHEGNDTIKRCPRCHE